MPGPRGLQLVQYLTADLPFGLMRYPPRTTVLDFVSLLSATGYEKDGLFFEPNTATLICEPSPIWEDMDATAFPSGSQTGGLWETATDPATGVLSLIQRASTADDAYSAESEAAFLEEDGAFCLTLEMGACHPDGTHDEASVYRQIEYPSDSSAGIAFRITFAYNVSPYVEAKKDGGSWVRLANIECPSDVTAFSDNATVTLTVLPMDGKFIFWLGKVGDWNRQTFTYPTAEGTAAGKLKISGKNGALKATFARLRFKKQGTFTSIALPAPPQINALPEFIFQGIIVGSQAATGVVASRDTSKYEFTAAVTLTGDPADDLASPYTAYNKTSPVIKNISIRWPTVYDPPQQGRWDTVEQVRQVDTRAFFDVKTGWQDLGCTVRVSNREGEYMRGAGIQAIRVILGMEGYGYNLIGEYVANGDGVLVADGGDSYYEFQGASQIQLMEDVPLHNDLYLGEWCCFAAAREVLEHLGVVPELMQLIPQCPTGPLGDHAHPKMPPGSVYRYGTMGLSVLADIQRLASLRMGPTPIGQFLVTPFDYTAPYTVKKVFTEQETGNLDVIHAPFTRTRSLRNLRNDITLVGIDPDTGRMFSKHYQDTLSLYNRLAPNHIPAIKPMFHAWAGYYDEDFTEERLAYLASIVTLPEELVQFPCWGQANLYPLDVIVPQERRTVGFSSGYFLSGVFHTWRAPATFISTLSAQWSGTGPWPGWG